MRNRIRATCTSTAALTLFLSAAAFAAESAAPSSSTLPPGLRPAVYAALAKDAGPAYAIGKNGCATLARQQLTACFTKDGARFRGEDAPEVSLRLAGYGRGAQVMPVKSVAPTIEGNRARYAHGDVTEWWRVLPVGFEQGFTVAWRPAGDGELTLALATAGKSITSDGVVSIGKLRYGDLVVTDASGKVVPSTLTTKHGRILIAVDDAGVRYSLTIDPLAWNEQRVTASDGANQDYFGYSVAIDGDVALIGAPNATIGGQLYQGAAYVFTRSGGTWSQAQKLTADDGAGGDELGKFVAIDDTIALAGAPFADIGGNVHQGAVYVFTDSGGIWSQTAKLTADDGAGSDQFGSAVALWGATAVVGAYNASVGGNSGQGAAYVFEDSGGTWSQTGKLTADDGAGGDGLGTSVAVSGATVVAGAPYSEIGGNASQGAVYVFTNSVGNWTQTQKLTASDGAVGDYFGYATALAGKSLIAGAPQADAAYVFIKSGGVWNQMQKLVASDGSPGDLFGVSVALEQGKAFVGAQLATVDSNQSEGAAYLFTESDGSWTQSTKLTPSDGIAGEAFGFSVALSGETALVGATYATYGYPTQQGAAYFYTATCPQGYGEHDGTLSAGGIYGSSPYQAPAGLENGILGGPGGFQLYAQYSNGTSQHLYRIPGNEIHKLGPAGTYRWGVKAGNTGGDYVLCVLHP